MFLWRSLSDVQETAQLLSGNSMPDAVLSALIASSGCSSKIGVINLTPYDGHLESHLLHATVGGSGYQFKSLSLSTDLTVIQHSEKICAMLLFED